LKAFIYLRESYFKKASGQFKSARQDGLSAAEIYATTYVRHTLESWWRRFLKSVLREDTGAGLILNPDHDKAEIG